MTRSRVRRTVAAALGRVLGVRVPARAVAVDCETEGLVFVGVPGYGEVCGRSKRAALANALRFIERWVATGTTSPQEAHRGQ